MAEGFFDRHETLSLSFYTTNTYINKCNDTTSTCTTTSGILESKATLHERNRALKTTGSEAGARNIQTESQRFCARIEKKPLKNDGNMFKESCSQRPNLGH